MNIGGSLENYKNIFKTELKTTTFTKYPLKIALRKTNKFS